MKNEMKAIVACGIAVLATGAFGQNLLKNGDGEDEQAAKSWKGFTKQYSADKKSGNACMASAFDEKNPAISPEMVPVSPSKQYKISGFFKAADKDRNLKFGIWVEQYDVNKARVDPYSVCPASGAAIAPLAVAAKQGDMFLTLPKDVLWQMHSDLFYSVVFNAKQDLSDLPNPAFAAIKKIETKDANVEIELAEPLAKDYPEGTKLRLHRYFDSPNLNNTELVPNEWNEVSFVLSGEAPRGKPEDAKLWNGTRFIKIAILCLDGGVLLFDDIKVEEVKK